MYEKIKNKTDYIKLLESGMFWEFYPELFGVWEKDNIIFKKCKDNQ